MTYPSEASWNLQPPLFPLRLSGQSLSPWQFRRRSTLLGWFQEQSIYLSIFVYINSIKHTHIHIRIHTCSHSRALTVKKNIYIYISVCVHNVEICGATIYNIYTYTSSTAQGGGGSFKNRKPIGEFGCCESGMAERSHWWIERWLISLALVYLSIYLSIYLSSCLPVYLWCSVIQCNVA